MVFFFGTKVVHRALPPERKVCPVCLRVTEHELVEADTRFTLYFIPLFSVRREVIYRCRQCGESFVVPYAEYQIERAAGAGAADDEDRWRVVPPPSPAGETAKGAGRAKSPRDKARLILEGKVVDGRADKVRPALQLNITSRHVMIALWVAFGVIVLAAAALLIAMFSMVAR